MKILTPKPWLTAVVKRGLGAVFGALGGGTGGSALLCFGLFWLAVGAQAQPATAPVGTPGLTADYYRGYFYDVLGFFTANAPVVSNRPVEQLNFAEAETDNFGVGPVATYYGGAGNPDEFSGRFRGQLYVTAAGPHTFYLGSDDAAYLFLDGNPQPVATNQGDTFPFRETTGTRTLAAGLHTVRVLYGEHGGSQGLVLQYAGPNMPKQLVPNGVLYAQPTGPLRPVLTRFEAVANNLRVDLSWATEAEENSTAFVVQKSTDGVVFTELLRQPGAAPGPHSYAAVDVQPAIGLNFYRLQQLRSDRPPVYSPIKAVEIVPVPYVVSVYPVPNNGNFFIKVQPANIESGMLELTDISGRRMYRQRIELRNGAAQQVRPNLATGMYILYFTTEAGTLVQKMLLGG
ncbi:T9SS type A sorting domain-containing protein [Hymenobacter nivis]|uniref:T9SS C-terminal target domain-containing protein n=1 Tax=Hymenobacter nivis TaxID=1850093 RepID=A0A502H0I5_9BACT|nr:T9SS type A sorting domain-containing protein [Hymenobacter nivis]TPG67604.1 T9SS C-terminal target domain-containing protein [Hymenobacter nivis]